ncbi:MAG: plasmid pRiA4b ORF-3 family protein [Anaerolineae bacterium]|nr:plasmid pRiA4b ORF-3 family protein [Anaerolineae bacterium]
MAKTMKPTAIYQIKATLKYSKPPIWRRILAPDTFTLRQLHAVLQIAMGWTNSHLHQFIVGNRKNEVYYGDTSWDDGDWGPPMVNEAQVRLNQLVTGEKFRFVYEYDFGDSWIHQLVVEKILPVDPDQHYPVCIKGKRACPVEDAGGVWGYMIFLEAINDPEHPQHDEYEEWIGLDHFDPEEFDLEAVNKQLERF